MTRPNVIIILADDLGFSDIGPFGGEIDTPSLERLAARGVRMSSYYVTPRCSPSRAALLTGHHPHSVGIGELTSDDRPRGYPGSLSTDVPTVAERLKEAGYRTGIFGKWHLSNQVTAPDPTWPTQRGFDEFRGILSGATSYYRPPLVQDTEPVPESQMSDEFYFTDDITESGVEFIRRQAASPDPFLLCLTYTAPHWPLHASESDIAKYRDRFSAGWTRVREQRLERMHDLDIVPGVDSLPVSPALPEWPERDQEWQIERMAVYAAQVDALDQGIGHILDALQETGAKDDTLVMFFSDNGGCAEDLPPGPSILNDDRLFPPRTRAGAPVRFGNDPQIMPGGPETYQSYGEHWATVSNAPFRMWKRWVHEGGISSPFIVSWPAGGVDAGGSFTRTPGHVIDILPTVLDAVGLSSTTEGHSLLTAWRNPSIVEEERPLYWEHIGNAAIRRGKYKLVREWGSEWELYDVDADRIESNNLASVQPERAATMLADYQRWADAHGVIPRERILLDDKTEK